MLILRDISYRHANGDLLFEQIDLALTAHDKTALIGNNGVGKSTLLKIIAGQLRPSTGQVTVQAMPFYVPQIYGQFNHLTVAGAMGVDQKLTALKNIINGEMNQQNLAVLDDDWTIENRVEQAFEEWDLDLSILDKPMAMISGGQKTKVMLASIFVNQPALVLLDEPSNHLDMDSRKLLYRYINDTRDSLLIVSHDLQILKMLPRTWELSSRGIKVYGGNYDFYRVQKEQELDSLQQELHATAKSLRKAKEKERETMERQQRLDNRGKKKQVKAGLPTISMNTFRNNAEKSTGKLKEVHGEKIERLNEKRNLLQEQLPAIDKMRFDFGNTELHPGKIVFKAESINFSYSQQLLWDKPLDFEILSGERILLSGKNAAGKTTLIKIILGDLPTTIGTTKRIPGKMIYIDQDYTLIDNNLTVFEQTAKFNSSNLPEHEVKNCLNKFLFVSDHWNKRCNALSGGEKMRLSLCCLTIGKEAPVMIILDEPTNNLDIQNVEILTDVINDYKGALLVVSHDEAFTSSLELTRRMEISKQFQ